MTTFSIVGAGYVADLYMRSLRLYPHITIVGVYDQDSQRSKRFSEYWGVKQMLTLEELFAANEAGGIVLNLTNPSSHFDISSLCLEAGFNVYSEKPLAMTMSEAYALVEHASRKSLLIASAPCSFLSEAAQSVWAAVRAGTAGKIRLVYAEMDDDFISQAPYRKWFSESGAPWPYKDEFEVGCTIEHAGYYLSWLIPIFGRVKTVVAASASLTDKGISSGSVAPDFSVGTLFFESGVLARITCSVVAPHNHQLRLIGDKGVIELDECWMNDAPVRFRKRFSMRRRLINSPIAKRLRLKGPTHPKLGRRGAAAMNFALGPVEMRDSIVEQRPCRISADLALHMNEITLALHNAGQFSGAQDMKTDFMGIDPMPWSRNLRGI